MPSEGANESSGGVLDSTWERQATAQTEGVNTTLDVQVSSDPFSYTNPGEVRGTLRTANGTPVANERVRLRIENRSRLVTTGANGSFAFQYRPRSIPLGTTPVEVQYDPEPSSVYRPDTATFTATVVQATPILSVERSPARVGYGDDLEVTTEVRVNGTGVGSVPVEIRIDGVLFKRLVTQSDGTATTAIQLPVIVQAGNQSVSATIPYEDRAIAGDTAATAITVETQPSALSLNATREDDAIEVTGQLTTADGRAIPNQPVRILLDGEQQTAVETAQNGRFETRLSSDGADTAAVTARYEQTNTNLGDSNASVTLAASESGADGLLGILQRGIVQLRAQLTVPVIAALLTGAVLVVFEITARRIGLFWSDDFPEDDVTVTTDRSSDPPEPTAATASPAAGATDQMDRALADGEYDTAVELAYDAIHSELTADRELRDNATHWELLEWCQERDFDPEQVESIRTVVEAYDRVAFSADTLDRSSAKSAVEHARQVQFDHP